MESIITGPMKFRIASSVILRLKKNTNTGSELVVRLKKNKGCGIVENNPGIRRVWWWIREKEEGNGGVTP